MNITLKYTNKEVSDYQELLNCFPPEEFYSPFRSTVPNLAYWSDTEKRVIETCKLLNLNIPELLTAAFEYQVEPHAGEGKPSHTDLMLTWKDHCIAIEAKYTEGQYKTVEKWLKSGRKSNEHENKAGGKKGTDLILTPSDQCNEKERF